MTLPKILVGICSCHDYKFKRDACRKSWLASPAEHIQTVFFVGQGETTESDVVVLNAADTYDALTEKVTAFFQYALKYFEFDYLFKCDDDTYVRLDRLHSIIAPEFDLVGKRYDGNEFVSGGAGYLLTRRSVENVCKLLPLEGNCEDVAISSAVMSIGNSKLKSDDRLQWNASNLPALDNDLITAHWCSPELMLGIYLNLMGKANSNSETE